MLQNEIVTALPLSWYFDAAVLEKERSGIFAVANTYLGALPLVPEHGHYHTLKRFDDDRFLVNNKNKINLLSNICPHRNMLLLTGSGKTARVVSCPMHKWAFDLDGTLIKAPHYPELPCLSLEANNVQIWNGLLFTGPRNLLQDLSPFGEREDLDISGYVPKFCDQEEQPVNWKIPIEVFLDNYHLPYVHPGLNLFSEPADWFNNTGGYEDEYLVFQEIPANPRFTKNSGSPVYEEWQNRILQVNQGKLPNFGLIVSLYFPNTILEWWPFMFIATTYQPLTPEKTLMTREYYFDPRILDIDPGYAALGKQAYDESQAQDDVLHEGIQLGRKHNYKKNPEDAGGYEIYQSPTEDCVKNFHERLMRDLKL